MTGQKRMKVYCPLSKFDFSAGNFYRSFKESRGILREFVEFVESNDLIKYLILSNFIKPEQSI